jgi:hypothetical protein
MTKTYTGWKVLLGLIAIYHLISGGLLLFSGDLAIQAVKTLAGVNLVGSPELGIIGEIMACYLLAFGLMMGIAAWNPVKNRAIITVGLVLFALRLFQRVFFADKVMQVMQIPSGRYWSAALIVATLALLLGVFRWQLYRDMHGAGE